MGSEGFSLRQLVASLLGLPIVLAITGCVAIPTSTEGGFDKKEELIKALIGTSIADVRSQLGEPLNTYELPDVTYLLYERRGEQGWFSLAHPLAMIWYQFPVGWGTTNLVQCLLIESRDDKVVHAEIKSDSDLTGAALHLTPINKSCPSLFWEKKELQRITAAQRFFCPKIYYRVDDSVKPQASDKFVFVCEGDKLSNEETELVSTEWDETLIYTDWTPAYSPPPRRYFRTVPKSLR